MCGKYNINESVEDYLKKVLSGDTSAPIDLEYISNGDTSGTIQFNGVEYLYNENDDGTFDVRPVEENTDIMESLNMTPQEVEKELSELSNKFTEREILIQTDKEEEKELALKILKKHYKYVEPSDGRMSDDDSVNWKISASDPLKDISKYDDDVGEYFSSSFND